LHGFEALKLHILFYFLVAAGLARLISFPFYPLMDTTEARYAEIARIMLGQATAVILDDGHQLQALWYQ